MVFLGMIMPLRSMRKTPLDTRFASAMLIVLIFLQAAARNMKMHPPLFRHFAEIEADMFFQIGLN